MEKLLAFFKKGKKELPASSAPVLFAEIRTANGKYLGVITLNVEQTLNALSLEMIDAMLEKLKQWATETQVVAVVIKGSGQKAFCAGGDIQALYRSAITKTQGVCEYAETFFEHEYRLDYLLHTYPKPVLCWGHGIVMGGGLGILVGCRHSVVTEKTRVAMPEVTIGLFPDVGGSWFLNRIPGRAGVFLALTGVSVDAADAAYTGLAPYYITHNHLQAVEAALLQPDWTDDRTINDELLEEALRPSRLASSRMLPSGGDVAEHHDLIDKLCGARDVRDVYAAIIAMRTEDPWLLKARNTMLTSSPLSAWITLRQLQLSKGKTLADVFRSELVLSTNIIRHSEFTEGVRALIIDKDKNPHWQFATLDDVPEDFVDQFFVPPWPENPLADL